MKYHFKTIVKIRLADTETPVSIYLKLRDHFSQCILLEYAGHGDQKDHCSYICCEPVAGIVVENETITARFPGGEKVRTAIDEDMDVVSALSVYTRQFSVDPGPFSVTFGLFGYLAYDAVRYFEKIKIPHTPESSRKIPDIRLDLYKYVLVFRHLHNDLQLVAHYPGHESPPDLQELEMLLNNPSLPAYPFRITSEERCNGSDEDFLRAVAKAQERCKRGDVFQIVLSRAFETDYKGDDINVYRALRSINPSPFLFYLDYNGFRLFGSSPEAQLVLKDGKATLHPIAGTYKRTGIMEEDRVLADLLQDDPKENAEHVMLVDLARNDLSRHYREISIPVYREIRQYSHVMHIVSEVVATDPLDTAEPLRVLADTFPAGTLSGAPKYRAMQLIGKYESSNRGYYGGSIGFIGFNGTVNMAIMIRSFLSSGNTLHYQAGAGIVNASLAASELQEINNKIGALRTALQTAKTI